jgi:hypothetical protein
MTELETEFLVQILLERPGNREYHAKLMQHVYKIAVTKTRSDAETQSRCMEDEAGSSSPLAVFCRMRSYLAVARALDWLWPPSLLQHQHIRHRPAAESWNAMLKIPQGHQDIPHCLQQVAQATAARLRIPSLRRTRGSAHEELIAASDPPNPSRVALVRGSDGGVGPACDQMRRWSQTLSYLMYCFMSRE